LDRLRNFFAAHLHVTGIDGAVQCGFIGRSTRLNIRVHVAADIGTGAKATPAAAASRAASAMETLLAFTWRSSIAGVGLLFTVPLMTSGVAPNFKFAFCMLSRSDATSSATL